MLSASGFPVGEAGEETQPRRDKKGNYYIPNAEDWLLNSILG